MFCNGPDQPAEPVRPGTLPITARFTSWNRLCNNRWRTVEPAGFLTVGPNRDPTDQRSPNSSLTRNSQTLDSTQTHLRRRRISVAAGGSPSLPRRPCLVVLSSPLTSSLCSLSVADLSGVPVLSAVVLAR
ncbi:hypothetical protein PIB30_001675 [Stylosanthes scabra]|uniref:Uncharacterized protein n=1 Tax=Stylosanthes scabra TaxID=79078 RepID=A0ABU6U5B3_9FABA|nr:hypothetical protein [Stylosanthes scabra]